MIRSPKVGDVVQVSAPRHPLFRRLVRIVILARDADAPKHTVELLEPQRGEAKAWAIASKDLSKPPIRVETGR